MKVTPNHQPYPLKKGMAFFLGHELFECTVCGHVISSTLSIPLLIRILAACRYDQCLGYLRRIRNSDG